MSDQPNFIFIIADDHRYRSLHRHGCAEVHTPNLDRLAERGADFQNAHCQNGFNGAVCVPSRASLMTGRNVFALDDEFREGGQAGFTIAPHMETFPQLLRGAGYRTHAIGKWHNDAQSFTRTFSSGSELFFGGMSEHDKVPLHDYDPAGAYDTVAPRFEAGHSTDIFRTGAERFLQQVDSDQPFLLYVAFTAPHDPRTPPDHFSVQPEDVTVPPDFAPMHPFDNGEMWVRDEQLEAHPRDPASIRRHLADYYGMIVHLDDAIGRILAAAEARGLLDNTVVIYTADHGLALGGHGLMGKQNLYQHSLNIPLILAGPGIKPGLRPAGLVWHGDTRATVLSLAGLGGAQTHDGVDLGPLLRGESEASPRPHFAAAYRRTQRMVRDQRFKLIRYYEHTEDMQRVGSSVSQLYDLQHDPYELNNLWFLPEMQPHRSRLELALANWQKSVGDPLAPA